VQEGGGDKRKGPEETVAAPQPVLNAKNKAVDGADHLESS